MHVEWKIVTSNPQVMRKLTEFTKNVLRMQHQLEACASYLGDGSPVTCIVNWSLMLMQCNLKVISICSLFALFTIKLYAVLIFMHAMNLSVCFHKLLRML